MARKKENKKKMEKYHERTRLIHGSFATGKWDYAHHVVPPLTSSATFRLTSVQRGVQGFGEFASVQAQGAPIYIYDRLNEPTRGILEENLAVSEGGEMCVTFATGMAAISAAIGAFVKSGDEVVAHHVLYGSTHSLLTNWLPRWGVASRFCDMTHPEKILENTSARCRIVYFETPVNPTMELIDMAAVKKVVDRLNQGRAVDERILIVVDNTFATPYCQRPLQWGADMVVHSLTKAIGGFGTEMGGAVIGSNAFYNLLMLYRKDFGGVLSPRNAWHILVYGLPTLGARMANQQKSAAKVAEFLTKHPKVARVVYPGLETFPQVALARRQMTGYDNKFAPGSMLYFDLKDASEEVAERMVDFVAENAYTITLAVSLGQIKTLIENPYLMTHATVPAEEKQRCGINPGGIRLSIGLEDWRDIIADLEAALAVI